MPEHPDAGVFDLRSPERVVVVGAPQGNAQRAEGLAAVAQSLVYGIDVGTTKVVALAGRVDPRRGWVEVLSMGEAPSYGLKRGVVVDRKAAADSIAEAMEACGVRGGRVTVGIAGSHISSFNTEVTLLNRGRNLTVTDRFVRRLEQEARQLDLHEDERVIHVVPRGYVLDGSEGVKNPVGLAARKVTMRAHVVSGAVSSIQNLLRAVEDCGVKVSNDRARAAGLGRGLPA